MDPVDQAVRDGRVAPARRDAYLRAYEADPEGTRVLLASLPATVPVSEVGAAGRGEDRNRDAAYPREWLTDADLRPPETGPGSITKVND